MGKLDKPTLAGLALCALPVAVFSAYSQFETARLAGVPVELAWVLPVTTDATGFVATRIWMTPHYSRNIRDYAAFIALTCIALSFAGAAAHLAYLGQPMPWWLRLTVGGLPSLALAALVHLGALLSAQKNAPVKPVAKSKKAPKAAGGGEDTPTSSSSAPEPPAPKADKSPAPEVGAGSKRELMLAYLDEHGMTSGAELDRIFGTKDYGRGVVKTWKRRHPQASGE